MNLTSWKQKFEKLNGYDFLTIPILIVSLIILSLLGMDYRLYFVGEISKQQEVMFGAIIQLMSYIIVILSIYLIHFERIDEFVRCIRYQLSYIKQHIVLLVIVFIGLYVLTYCYNALIQFMPGKMQFNETQNELKLSVLFDNPTFLPITFIFVVIAAPMIEEFIFRHLIIGELGKIFNYYIMGVVSAVLFTLIHVTGAHSPLEFGSYIILASGLVLVYLKSGRKLGASLFIHALNNFVAFVISAFF